MCLTFDPAQTTTLWPHVATSFRLIMKRLSVYLFVLAALSGCLSLLPSPSAALCCHCLCPVWSRGVFCILTQIECLTACHSPLATRHLNARL